MSVLLDTDVLIEVLRGRDATIVERWTRLMESDEPVLYSPVTSAEVWAGARPNEERSTEEIFAAMIAVPIDAETGRIAGLLMHRFAKSHSVELADALIAAAAMLTGAQLWTRNRKHYPMPGVAFY